MIRTPKQSKTSGSLAFVPFMMLPVVAGLVALLGGCPERVQVPPDWTPVTAKVHDKAKTSDFDKREQERMRREKFETEVTKGRIPLVKADERVCKIDTDCTPIPQHCCSCSRGGRKVAVSRAAFKDVISRRTLVCREMSCREVVSDDATCAATTAKCEKGQCVLVMPKEGAAKAPSGVGVETIPETK